MAEMAVETHNSAQAIIGDAQVASVGAQAAGPVPEAAGARRPAAKSRPSRPGHPDDGLDLERAMELVFQADRDLRSARPDDRIVMEQFILQLTA